MCGLVRLDGDNNHSSTEAVFLGGWRTLRSPRMMVHHPCAFFERKGGIANGQQAKLRSASRSTSAHSRQRQLPPAHSSCSPPLESKSRFKNKAPCVLVSLSVRHPPNGVIMTPTFIQSSKLWRNAGICTIARSGAEAEIKQDSGDGPR